MILTYNECISRYGSDYKLKKEIADGNLFVREKGIYSTEKYTSEIDIIMRKYPRAVCTGRSALYYHYLTDVIPDHYHLATRRTDTRIHDNRVIQTFMTADIFDAGITEIKYNNSSVRIYNLERMLIEVMRFRSKIPMDYYKEVILNYRNLVFEMDFNLIEDYAGMFRNRNSLMDMIQLEVM